MYNKSYLDGFLIEANGDLPQKKQLTAAEMRKLTVAEFEQMNLIERTQLRREMPDVYNRLYDKTMHRAD